MKLQQKGFTLIELMIAVVIVAILAVIAIPSYTDYVTRARRADGQSALMQVAQVLERCYTQFSAYNNGGCSVVASTGATALTAQNSDEGWYQITGVLASTSFTLTATPQGVQATNDTDCTTLTLTHLGVKGATGADSTSCW